MALTKISTAMWNAVPHHLSHDFNVDDVLFVDVSADQVGIGTTSPASKVHVDFTADFDGLRIQNSNRGHNYLLTTSGTTAQYFNIYDLDNSRNLFSIGDSGATIYTGGNPSITIGSSGNVGIGTAPYASTLGTFQSIDLGQSASMWGYLNSIYLNSNAYFNNGWLYKNTASAGVFQINGDSLNFRQAASGTAGTAISLTEAFSINSSGVATFAGPVISEGPDGGMVMREWTAGSTFGMIGTANMAGQEYALLTDGTSTFIGSAAGGTTYIRGPVNDDDPEILLDGSQVLVRSNGADTLFGIQGNSSGQYDPILNFLGSGSSIATEGAQIWYDNSVGDLHISTTYANDAADIHFYTRTGTNKGTNNERLTISGNGNVGIGATSPSYKLHVEGNVQLGGSEAQNRIIKMGSATNSIYMGGANVNTLNVGYDENQQYNLHINYNGYQGSTSQFRNLIVNDGKHGLIAQFVGSTGNVGIGTSSPTSGRLVVHGGDIEVRDSTGNAGGRIKAYDNYHSIYLREGGQNKTSYYQYGGTLSAGLGHRFLTGGTSQSLRMQIADDGIYMANNVGMGITPTSKLDIKPTTGSGQGGTVVLNRAGDRSTLQAYYVINSTGYGDELYMGVGANSSDASIGARHGSISFQTGSYAERLNINTSGNVVATVDMRAPIFYDSGATSYYADFASLSNLNQVNMNGRSSMMYAVSDLNSVNGNVGITGFKSNFAASNRPGTGNYATGIEFTYHDSNARTQLAAASSGSNNTGELWVRSEAWGTSSWSSWWKLWHQGNDGSGSGLDADLLDGQHGSFYAERDHIRSLGVPAFTGGANPNITTAQLISEMEGDGAFDSYSSVFKTTWSYAGNYNLTDAGRFTETAGTSWITWTDNSSDSTRGNITALAIAPNTGGSARKVFIYNDQGSSYAPGWREIWTSGNTIDSGLAIYAPTFYDYNNTGYYVDPAGTSNFGSNTIFNVGSKASSDTSSLVRFNGNYTNGQYTHRFRKQDLGGGIPLFVDYAHGTANSYTALARFGYYTGNGYEFEVFGDSHSTASSRAPVFYDSNNTAGYANLASDDKSLAINGGIKFANTNAQSKSGFIGRHGSGGSLSTDLYPGAIYSIGDNYRPSGTGLSNHYGVGYSHTNASFYGLTGQSGWGFYVSDAGTARVQLSGSNGTISCTGDVVAYASDGRLKENIKPIENALEKVSKINGVYYDWVENIKEEYDFHPSKMHEVGVIAQEIQDVMPEVVDIAPFDMVYSQKTGRRKIQKKMEAELNREVSDKEAKEEFEKLPIEEQIALQDKNDFLTVKYERLVPLLIEAVKELSEKVKMLENK